MRRWQTRFFTIWTGQAFSLLGSKLVSFALIWWLTETTGSVTTLATASLVTLLPPVLLGPFAGTLVDRWSRRAVMIVADGIIALLTAVLAVLFLQGVARPWHLYVILFLRSLGGAFHQPAMMASTSLLVPRDQLTRVGGMNHALGGLLRIVVPPAGALLLSAASIAGILMIDIITAGIAIGTLLFTSTPQPSASAEADLAPSFYREFTAGLRFVWDWRPLFVVVSTCTLANIFLGPAQSLMPLLVAQDFGGEALQLSLVMSLQGIGIIAGGFVMSLWGGFKRNLMTSALGWVGVGLAYTVVALTPGTGFTFLLALMFFLGFSVPVGCAPLDAFYQSCVPPDKQGRVFAVLGSIDQATMPLGLVLAGALGDRVPVRAWRRLVGISHLLLALSWMLIPSVLHAEDELERTPPILAA